MQNLGLGNRADVREREAEQRQALLQLLRTQDRVTAEVVQALAQVQRSREPREGCPGWRRERGRDGREESARSDTGQAGRRSTDARRPAAGGSRGGHRARSGLPRLLRRRWRPQPGAVPALPSARPPGAMLANALPDRVGEAETAPPIPTPSPSPKGQSTNLPPVAPVPLTAPDRVVPPSAPGSDWRPAGYFNRRLPRSDEPGKP